MTEQRTDRQHDFYADELEKRRQLAEWREQKRLEREEAERRQKRADLEAHLAERARGFLDITGSAPGADLLARWQDEYVDRKQREAEADLAARRQASIAENYDFSEKLL